MSDCGCRKVVHNALHESPSKTIHPSTARGKRKMKNIRHLAQHFPFIVELCIACVACNTHNRTCYSIRQLGIYYFGIVFGLSSSGVVQATMSRYWIQTNVHYYLSSRQCKSKYINGVYRPHTHRMQNSVISFCSKQFYACAAASRTGSAKITHFVHWQWQNPRKIRIRQLCWKLGRTPFAHQ